MQFYNSLTDIDCTGAAVYSLLENLHGEEEPRMLEAVTNRYPVGHRLEDGASITCSLMSHEDRGELSKLLGRLSRNDLAYLQVDITQPENQNRWFDQMVEGKSIGICAFDPAQLVGYASVHISDDRERRTGEIRVNISQGYRSRGLGRILISEVFEVSKLVELKAVTARMLADQHGARSAFERLGFVKEKEHVTSDRKNLLVMSATLG